jgi:Holliday junction resolvase
MKLTGLFSDWTIDCEYNRDGTVVKKLIYAVSPKGMAEERNVVPDIIIHHRQTTDNLLAIEVKKSSNQENSIKDLNKLAAFREQLGYANTLFVRFKTGASAPAITEIEFV